jgi:serine/threonine protein phosphatase 1
MALTYAIADLHGRYDLLQNAIGAIKTHAQAAPHTIITLGDYIDRGPNSAGIIKALREMHGRGEVICLKGNHEDIMLQTICTPLNPSWWLGNGGGPTLISYGHDPKGVYEPGVVPTGDLEWLSGLPMTHVDQHRIYVHAGVERGTPLDQQDSERMMWMRYSKIDEGGFEGLHVVHGHEQYEDGPLLKAGRTDLDTFAWYTGRLAVGVFDDARPGGPIDILEVIGEPHEMRVRELAEAE